MLQTLKIQNFKNIKNLDFPDLATINLITGKNNTSKTSLLEAIAILASHADFEFIYSILQERGELFHTDKGTRQINNIKSLGSLFHNRNLNVDEFNAIFIGNEMDYLRFEFIKYVNEIEKIEDNEKNLVARKYRKRVENIATDFDSLLGLELQLKNTKLILPISENEDYRFRKFVLPEAKKNFQFIKPTFQENDFNATLWDKITLSEKEEYVIEALKIIEPNLEKIAFVKGENARDDRKATAKIKGFSERIALKSMGDGINRMLAIVLGLVNSENGCCLIDEFENGLHYSVQEKLWKIVFKLATKLNVQVFATTHSNDCINSFSEVINTENYNNLGRLFRLDRVKDEIKLETYYSKDLQIATENNIETR
jgi:AAA15 family ATPase/GTPase